MVIWNVQKYRDLAAWVWSFGLATIALDRFLYYDLGEYNLRLCYFLFSISALLVCRAELREFGARVALYRLHDLVIGGPWKYLLLYFLWVNIFAPISENPARSVIYATAGWFSLLAVSISAQFIFCEYRLHGTYLVPSRLHRAFSGYAIAICVLGLSFLINYFAPSILVTPFFEDNVHLLLYFVIGFPFLFWDFTNSKRHILPRYISGPAMMVAVATVFLIGHQVLFIGLLTGPLLLMLLGFIKRVPLQRSSVGLVILCLISVNVAFLAGKHPKIIEARQKLIVPLEKNERQLKRKMESWEHTLQVARGSNFLGTGIGGSDVKNGVWNLILAEVGLMGLLLYVSFFGSLLRGLYLVRRARQLFVSHAALVSMVVFILFGSHYLNNPYGAAIWVWYAIWGLVAVTPHKQEVVD